MISATSVSVSRERKLKSSKERLLVDLTGTGQPGQVVDADGRLRDPTAADARLERIALVDAGRCTMVAVDLPRVSGRRLEQALRWAAEEHLAGDAEDQHVAPVARDETGRMRCVVVSAATMEGWLESLPAHPDRLIPDAACLPWQAGELVLLPRGKAVLVRWGNWDFDRIDTALLEHLLPELLAAAGENPTVVWYGAEPPDWLRAGAMETRSVPSGPLGLLAEAARESPVNLMTGRFAAPSTYRIRRRWGITAGLAAGVAALAVVHGLLELNLLKRESARLDGAISEQLAEAFPDIGRVERPREQAERELARLRYGQSAGLLDLLGRATPVVGDAPGVRVESVSFRDGELELALEVGDVADMEALENRLAALDMDARVQGLAIGPDSARGRIRIRGTGQ